jgi:hypothetical protein
MARLPELGRLEAPDLAALEPRVQALRELRQRLPQQPRIVSSQELQAGLALMGRLPSAAGYEPGIPPRRSARLARELGIERLAYQFRVRYADAWQRLGRHPGAAAAVGIGLVVSPRPAAHLLESSGYRVVAELPGGDLALYREPVPRFHLVGDASFAADEDESLRRVLDPAFDPVRTVVLEGVPEGERAPFGPDAGVGEVVLLEDRPEEIRLRVETRADSILVVSDTFYPGWQARIDGAETPILRANYALRALRVPAGSHEVELLYRPRSFRLGVVGSGLGVLLVLGLWWRLRRRGPSRA